MNIVIAPDSFKGSLTAKQVTEIMREAILTIDENNHVTMKPMADGGEGTIESLLTATKGRSVSITCKGPLGDNIQTTYAIIESETAIIECANIAGLVQVPISERNPDHTTSYGIGEAILAALDQGCTSIIIGLGGSATNDGGLGMLLALGMKAWDKNGHEIGPFGKDIHNIEQVDLTKLDPRLATTHLQVASDVDNPLCGKEGASYIYGAQKGATPEQMKQYDDSLDRYSDLIETITKRSFKTTPGAGAAGGLGFALLVAGAEIVSGAAFLADFIKLEESIQGADLVITGEGQSDRQTLYGKAPGYVASLAKKHNIPAILISGGLTDVEQLSTHFLGCFSIINQPLSLEECISGAQELLFTQTTQVFQLISKMRQSS